MLRSSIDLLQQAIGLANWRVVALLSPLSACGLLPVSGLAMMPDGLENPVNEMQTVSDLPAPPATAIAALPQPLSPPTPLAVSEPPLPAAKLAVPPPTAASLPPLPQAVNLPLSAAPAPAVQVAQVPAFSTPVRPVPVPYPPATATGQMPPPPPWAGGIPPSSNGRPPAMVYPAGTMPYQVILVPMYIYIPGGMPPGMVPAPVMSPSAPGMTATPQGAALPPLPAPAYGMPHAGGYPVNMPMMASPYGMVPMPGMMPQMAMPGMMPGMMPQMAMPMPQMAMPGMMPQMVMPGMMPQMAMPMPQMAMPGMVPQMVIPGMMPQMAMPMPQTMPPAATMTAPMGGSQPGAVPLPAAIAPAAPPPPPLAVHSNSSPAPLVDSAADLPADAGAPPASAPPPAPLAPLPAIPTPGTTSTTTQPLMRRTALNQPELRFQGVYIYQGDEGSGRARVTGTLPVSPNLLFGGTVDFVDGRAFTDSENQGINLNELYLAASLPSVPNLRLVVGQLDLTSYFDRNSFAKDGASMFFNSAFQTNPALAASGIGSRQAALLNWSVTDFAEAKAAVFSSARDVGDFSVDGFAGELGFRLDNFIVRGTYATNRDGGRRDAFREIFQIDRGDGRSGVLRADREEAFGINTEIFIPEIKLGIFGRYGQYTNQGVNRTANTYNVGITLLDLFMQRDRLGIAYGQQLSNDRLRRQAGDRLPDAFEVFYDFAVLPNLRLGFSFQSLDNFSETILGVRVKTDFNMVAPK